MQHCVQYQFKGTQLLTPNYFLRINYSTEASDLGMSLRRSTISGPSITPNLRLGFMVTT